MSMKKSIFLLAAAAAAFASCTQNEVMEVAENRAIGFNAFVNNNTRAVTEVTTSGANGTTALSSYYVFGYSGADVSSLTNPVYQNESNSKIAYWVPSQIYRFAAYADGNGNSIPGATFAADTKILTINDYTPDDAKDLVAAVPTADTPTGTDVSSMNAVSLPFVHLLSQVAFEFTTDAADSYTLTISDVVINGAKKTASCAYNGTGAPTWTGTAESGTAYTYEDFTSGIDIASKANNYMASQSKLVIPQNETNNLTVTFKATLTGDGVTGTKEQTFTGYLGYAGTTPATANTWVNGYRYKYTAKINPEDVDDTLKDKIIEFTPSVTDWENTDPEDTDLPLNP